MRPSCIHWSSLLALVLTSLGGLGHAQQLPDLDLWEQAAAAAGNPDELSQMLTQLKELTGFRDWTAKSGNYTVRGKYVGINLASQKVIIKKNDGKTVSPALALLSEKDVVSVEKILTLQTQIADMHAALVVQVTKEHQTQMTEVAAELAKTRTALVAANANGSKAKPPAGAAGVQEVRVKHLNALGAKYVGKKVRFTGVRRVVFVKTGFFEKKKLSAYVGDALRKPAEVGNWGLVRFTDEDSNLFQHGFAKSADFAEVILDLNDDDKVNVYGTVQRYQYAGGDQYGLTIETIEKATE